MLLAAMRSLHGLLMLTAKALTDFVNSETAIRNSRML